MLTRYKEYRKRVEKAREEAVAEAIKAYKAWDAWNNNGAREDEMPEIPPDILDVIQRESQDKNALDH